MNQFIKRLKQASQSALQPMGFKAGQAVSQRSKMLLVARLTKIDMGNLADYVAGADAGLLPISQLNSGIQALKKISQAVPDIPWGGWLRDISWAKMKRMKKFECDFVIFPAVNTSLTILEDNEVGKILEVGTSINDRLLKTINELPVDAVLITGERREDYFLTWQHLMLFWHFADSLTKPLLVSVPSRIKANEVQLLWEAGVSGVIVEAGSDGLKGLRQAIDQVVFSPQRERRKAGALLPHISPGMDVAAEEEEEE